MSDDSKEKLDLRSLLSEHIPSSDSDPGQMVTMEILAGLFEVSEEELRAPDAETALHTAHRQELGKRYESRGELGRGGVGRVGLAMDRNLGREVAVKTLLDPDHVTRLQVKRFIQEARITAQLDHPSVVPVYEFGTTRSGELYYTMKRVEGIALSRIIRGLRRRERRFTSEYSSARLLRILLAVSEAVAYAHDRGVVHGDIKPQNIMVGNYGEVLLMDWGFATIIGGDSSAATLPREEPNGKGGEQRVFGTPGYVSPERVAGSGPVGPLSDVYSLGCVLFELLTFRRVFEVRGANALLKATVENEPPLPSDIAPGRQVAEDLEALCMFCLAKVPSQRPESATVLAKEIVAYLEGSQRREEAKKRIRGGRAALQRHLKLRDRVRRAEELTEEIRGRIETWRPMVEKGALLAGHRRLEQLRGSTADAYAEAVTSFESALSLDPDNPDARSGLADAYWLLFEEAERNRDKREMTLAERTLMLYDDGRYAVRIKGEGALTLDSDPTHSQVICLRYERRELRLFPIPHQEFGRTPLRLVPLPMGSYVLIFRANGYHTTRYPIQIQRREHLNPQFPIPLVHKGDVSEEFVFVPGSRFRCGGDHESPSALETSEPMMGDFLIGRFPVTARQYRDFLDDMQGVDPDEARRRAPKRTGVKGTLWTLEDGHWVVPAEDRNGNRWHPSHPVCGVSWEDAMAYIQWRSRKEIVHYHLPTDMQWEKASRGVDARFYPWGDWFDPSLCSMRESCAGSPRNRPVGAFPDDVSPYGVADMAGGVQEWSRDWFDEGAGQRSQRGGAWLLGRRFCRLANRRGRFPWTADLTSGFRLVRNMP